MGMDHFYVQHVQMLPGRVPGPIEPMNQFGPKLQRDELPGDKGLDLHPGQTRSRTTRVRSGFNPARIAC